MRCKKAAGMKDAKRFRTIGTKDAVHNRSRLFFKELARQNTD